jgi:uncharacterized protein (TIGR03435 family)
MNRSLRAKSFVFRAFVLIMIGMAVFLLPSTPEFVHASPANYQTMSENSRKDIAGTWQGTLHVGPNLQVRVKGKIQAGGDLRIVVKLSEADDGTYKAIGFNVDESVEPIPIDKVTLEGTTVRMSSPFTGSDYEGNLAADGRTISGNMTSYSGVTLPLNLTRATAETEWTLPPSTPKPPSMAPDATPDFVITTIKPAKPDQRRGLSTAGNQMGFTNITVNDLIGFAYDIHPKQAIETPPWTASDKYDIDLKPQGEGMPSRSQWKDMLRRLLAERFKLAFHRETKELSIYALSIGKTGPKLMRGDPEGIPTLSFGVLGSLHAINATMADFTQMMQTIVLDRPVIDQTRLQGRFNFDLNWKRDESQFTDLESIAPPLPDAHPLNTAIQEQIGLKLEETKAPVEGLVIDHVEKPSTN